MCFVIISLFNYSNAFRTCSGGIAMVILIGIGANGFTLGAFVTSAFINGIPGILLQLILIPSIMRVLKRTHVPYT